MTTLVQASPTAPSPRRFTRDEYYRMFNMGMFDGQRVELIHGEIITMAPQNEPHALTIAIITGWLSRGLGENFTVRCQLPVVASDDTEPEPDFAVLAGSAESQRDHPTTALLMIEVADSSLAHDRRKGDIYASRGVSDYWIVSLQNRQLEVYRNPVPSTESETGMRYMSKAVLTQEQTVTTLNLPLPAVKVGRLLPIAV